MARMEETGLSCSRLLGPSWEEEKIRIFRDLVSILKQGLPTAQGLWSVICPLTEPRAAIMQPLPGGTGFSVFSLLVKGRPCFSNNKTGGFRESFLILTLPGHLDYPRMWL